jgi:ArsR family metal-binding transcriptional regulator
MSKGESKMRIVMTVANEIIDSIELYRVMYAKNKYKNKSQYFAELLPRYLSNPDYFGFELTKEDITMYSKLEVSKTNNVTFYVSKDLYERMAQNATEHMRSLNAEIRLFLFSLYKYFKPHLLDKSA